MRTHAHSLRQALGTVAAALAVLAMAACGSGESQFGSGADDSDDQAATNETVDEYVVGSLAQMTGDVAWFGELVQNATTLAIEDVNADGGIDGKPFDVKFRDLQNDAAVSVSEFRKFAEVDGIPAVMVGSSIALLPACPIAEEEEVVFFNAGASSPLIEPQCGDFTIGNLPTSQTEMETLAQYLWEDRGFRQAATFNMNNDVNVGMKDAFVEAWEALGGEILAEESAEPGTQNFRSQISALRAAEPPATLVATEAQDTARFLRQARDLQFESQLVAQSNAINADVVKEAEAGAEGMVFASVLYDPEGGSDVQQEFVDRYTERFGESPALLYSALAYDATMMLAEAIENGGYSGPAIQEYLMSLDEYSGVSGTVTYPEPGVATREVQFSVVEDGEIVPLETGS